MENVMQKIQESDLLLFDMDGLLVDTERVHYRAYQKMCLSRGFALPWDFSTYCHFAHRGSEFHRSLFLEDQTLYCHFAHRGSDLLEKGIYEILPDLKVQEPHWKVLHQEKQEKFLEIVAEEGVDLMLGVELMLQVFPLKEKRSCVVTHSSEALARAIYQKLPILRNIPFWVTREQYTSPKPAPDAYLTAIRLYGKPGDKIVGFEDSLRGYLALESANVPAVVISSILSLEVRNDLQRKQVYYFSSFNDFVF